MTSIIIALPKMEDAKGLKNVLVRSGFRVTGICNTGAQAISLADGLNDGIVICSYKMADMIHTELRECLPQGFELLVLASQRLIGECYGTDVMYLSMPLNAKDFVNTVSMVTEGIERRRKKRRSMPRQRDEKEEMILGKAKEMLMARNHMTEEQAHKYLQKCSMDSGNNLVETAQMVLTMMRD